MVWPALRLTLTHLTVTSALLLIAGVVLAASAQTLPVRPAPSPQPTPRDQRDDDVDFGSRQSDARTKLILKAEKKAYEEHVARAKEVSDLALELQKTYETAHLFNAADHKKLERMEKLARRIRNEVGGSQTDGDPKELPKTTSEAVTLLVDMTKELQEEVERTPRRVVSASIIDQANKLIVLIQHLRESRD